MDLRKGLLWVGIGAIAASGLISAFIVLFSTLNEIQIKIILSTLTLGWYSLATSLTLGFKEQGLPRLSFMPYVGAVVSGTGSFLSLLLIWSGNIKLFESENYMKTLLISFICSFVVAYSSILLKTLSSKKAVNVVALVTTSIVVLLGMQLIYWIMMNFENISEFSARLMWVLAIFGVTGSMILPLVKKLSNKEVSAS